MSTISRRGALKSTAAISMLASIGCGKSQGPASDADLANLDAIATAQAIKNGDVTALEVINAAITRAESANQKIHAIVSPYFDTARDKATAAPEGPWFGVPTFIKDLNDVIGQRTSFGSRAYANYIASEQSPLVDAIFGTGLISLGKSSTPEFGLTATTEPMLGEPTRNPWNTDYSVGGSSGGAAALAAARVTPVAHASDGGGSIRIPASCCGLVGLKPSRGRTPLPPRKSPRPVELTTQLAVTRTVRDTAAFLSMMELDNELPPVGLVEGPSSDRKKIAFFTETPTGAAVDPEVVASTRAVADQLEDLGHEVSEITSPFDAGVLQDFTIYWGAGAAGAVADWEKATGRPAGYTDFEPWTFGMIEYFTARQSMLEAAIGRLISFEQLYQTAFSGIDLMLSPVLAAPPPKIGHLSPRHAFPLGFDRISEYVSFTQYHNVSGAPAISLPLGVSSNGLPIGAQIAAMPGHERSILEVAYELEEAMPWASRTPAGFA